MESIYLLIPLSIILIGIGVWAFFWAVDRGQFEDLEPAARLALEEDAAPTASAAASEPRRPRS
jgi:cbb3-type cytochrome oxidase maturation protein